MNKVYALAPSEDWIVDRFVKEWNADNKDITVQDTHHADVIWLMADWCWRQLPYFLLTQKKVITTIHHIVPEKFGEREKAEFAERDLITNVYHVPNVHTELFVRTLTKRPVVLIPYWANQIIWKKTGDKVALKKKYNIPMNAYVMGSFQRDTEGHDLKSPKLEKGPDLLGDYFSIKKSLCDAFTPPELFHVVLAGWRRQYIISRLESMGINYTYIEKPSQQIVNELYQTLDEYPVTARQEGGPQSIIECGLLGIPVVSRDIGVASALLDKVSINHDVSFAVPTVPNVSSLMLPMGYIPYRNLISSL